MANGSAIKRLQQFKAGHLLTANDLNLLVDAIKELDRRLTILEAVLQKLRRSK